MPHYNNRRVFAIVFILVGFSLVSACTNAVLTPLVTATPVFKPPVKTTTNLPDELRPGKSPTVPIKTITHVPTATLVIERPSATPVWNKSVTWADRLQITLADGIYEEGAWSPTRNEAVYYLIDKTNDAILKKFAAPDFQSQEIRAPFTDPYNQDLSQWKCESDSILWTLDGNRIFFGGPPSDLSGFLECNLWMVERDKGSPRRYMPIQNGRNYQMYGWISDHTMIISTFLGGTRVLDLLTGNERNAVHYHSMGEAFFTRDYYVANDNFLGGGPSTAFALGPRFEYLSGDDQNNDAGLKYVTLPPLDSKSGMVWNYASDFLPGTNKVLVDLAAQMVKENGGKIVDIKFIQKLILWDIDNQTTATVVPYATCGRFSPDHRLLAYLTVGPAKLDEKNRPVESVNNEVEGVQYLQLMDMGTREVSLSVPITTLMDFDSSNYYHPGMNFSPNGRYLALMTDRELVFDQTGWPEMHQAEQTGSNSRYLYILDLQNHKLVWHQSGLARDLEVDIVSPLEFHLPIWSPKGDKFTYLDSENNIVLTDLIKGSNISITQKLSGLPVVKWSHDGAYLSIQLSSEDGYGKKIAFLHVP